MTVLAAVAPLHPVGMRAIRAVLIGLAATLAMTAYAATAARLFEFSTLASIGIFAAAGISSVAGFAFSALCAPLLAPLDLPPIQMVQTMAVCSIAIQASGVWSLRRELDLTALAPLLAGGLCTLPLGVILLTQLPSGGYAAPVGALILCYGLWALIRPPIRIRRQPGWLAHMLVGATGGMTGGLAAFPGAAVAVWCGMHHWPKERQRAVTQTYILAMQISLLSVIGVLARQSDPGSYFDLAILAYVPPALMGAACGHRFFRGLTDRGFARAVNCLLIAAGLAMVM